MITQTELSKSHDNSLVVCTPRRHRRATFQHINLRFIMGKGGEKSATPVDVSQEVLIDGRFYDVSKMKHPGGSVIKFYAGKGIDATQAFDNFHLRSKKAKKILDHLPSRAADKKEMEQNLLPGQQSLLEDFNQLSRDRKSSNSDTASMLSHFADSSTPSIILPTNGDKCL